MRTEHGATRLEDDWFIINDRKGPSARQEAPDLPQDFYPSRNGEQAGLTCYYSTATYARFSLCYEEGRKLLLVINRNRGEELIASVDGIREQSVCLKESALRQ